MLKTLCRSVFIGLLIFDGIMPCLAGNAPYTEIEGGQVEEDTSWSGDYIVTGHITISPGAVLAVKEGSNLFFRGGDSGILVQGGIEVNGRNGKPVVFSAEPGRDDEWGGIVLSGAEQRALFRYAVLRGAKTALSLVHSSAVIKESVFEENDVAVDVSMEASADVTGSTFAGNGTGLSVRLQSKVKVEKCRFEGNREFGLSLTNGGGGRITGNVFRQGSAILIKQGKDVFLGDNVFTESPMGVYAEQVRHDVRITGNRFEGGGTGIQSFSFSTPWIACNEFRDLETAVVAARFSRPLVERCLFERNRQGVNANNKSNVPVKNNIFLENKEAVFVDMSSYPVISENNFLGNTKGIVLGIYMSADWEKRVGSSSISGAEARRRGSRSLEGVVGENEFKGEVDARNNWWGGKTTAEMTLLGPNGNVTAIDDYYDRNEVTYPGFGEGSYRLDRVVYSPWRERKVEVAGPLPGGCSDLLSPGSPAGEYPRGPDGKGAP